MKRICVFLFFILLLVPAFTLEALVVSVLGKAETQTLRGWKPMETGERLAAGTIISTGFRSQAVLKIGKSTVIVQPLSRLTLEQLNERADTDVSKIYLDAGSIKADVKAAENKRVGFTVKSPVATASVRGTAGTIDAFGTLESTSGVWMVGAASKETQKGAREQTGIAVPAGSAISFSQSGRLIAPQQQNIQAATSSASVFVLPSMTEVSGNALAFAATAAQNALGNVSGSDRKTLPVNIGWED